MSPNDPGRRLRTRLTIDSASRFSPDRPRGVWTFPQRDLVIASLLRCPDLPGADGTRRSDVATRR
jgi:hypothetical protein